MDKDRTSLRNMISRKIVSNARTMVEDKCKNIREPCNVCQACYYSNKVGMCVMTYSRCENCDKDMVFGSSNTNRLCPECAKELGLCKRCGAEMGLGVNNV